MPRRVARALLGEAEVLPIGLGARDSLRLEAGLCLYGHDIDETTQSGGSQPGLVHRQAPQGGQGFSRRRHDHGRLQRRGNKRVGILPEGRAPAREGTEIADKTGRIIGKITSGGFGPSLNAPVAMGYVESAFAANGTKLDLMVRGKALPAAVAPMPFVPNRYKRQIEELLMSEVRYTDQHEWIRLDGDEATVGITKYAAESLGDVVFVELPASGKHGRRPAAKPRWWKASRRPATSMPRPAAPSPPPTARWKTSPSKVNEDPEGEGWFFKLKLADKGEFAKLMDAAAYAKFVEGL